jgi:hypothetical protein
MEVLQFDSRFPNQKYRDSVNELTHALAASSVICRDSNRSTLQRVFHGFEIPVAQPDLAFAIA